jgi:hypothetical protein
MAVACSLVVSLGAGAWQTPKATGGQVLVSKGGLTATIKGYVIDSACTFRSHLKKPVSTECATKCARAGSPLVILTEDGTIYLPISSEMPATGQNDKLMKYAGQMVTVTGTPYTQGGSRAIVIEKIEALKDSQ